MRFCCLCCMPRSRAGWRSRNRSRSPRQLKNEVVLTTEAQRHREDKTIKNLDSFFFCLLCASVVSPSGVAMSSDLIDLVQRLGQPRVLVVGDLMLDRYVWGNAARVSQEAPVLL